MKIKVNDVSKVYVQGEQKILALDKISFEVIQGQSLAILGPSGSGKTTLISIIAGLEEPTSGEVLFDNFNLNKMSNDEINKFRSENIGFIFQQFHLMPHLTAFENVCLPFEIQNKKDYESLATKALNDVGLSHRLNHYPKQLSGGECQRVAVARAIVNEPPIIIADEPSGSLDAENGSQIMDLIFNLVKQKGITLLLVTHDLHLATKCAIKISLNQNS